MPSAYKRPSALRDSWRPTTRRGGLRRRLRQWSVTALALALVVLLGVLLFSPFFHPNSHLLLVAANDYQLQGTSAIRQPVADLSDFSDLSPALHSSSQQIEIHTLSTPAALDDLMDRLEDRVIRSGDVVIIQIRAYGVSLDGEPCFLTEDFDASASQGGRYALAKLLDRMGQIPAQHRLLVLDSGTFNYDPRLGLVVNEFPSQLQRQVLRSGDPGLWVLHSHSPLERSHESRDLGHSVFGHFVGQGLRGAADANQDRFVELDELFRFVRSNVEQWVERREAGSARQTPMLLNGAGEFPPARNPVLLSVSQVGLGNGGPTALLPASSAPTSDARGGAGTASRTDSAENAASLENGADASDTAVSGDPASESSDSVNSTSEDNSAKDSDDEARREPPRPAFGSPQGSLAYDVWLLLDRVHGRQIDGPNPIDYAPHLWRRLSRRLLRQSHRVAQHGTDADAHDTQSLQKLMRDVANLVDGKAVRPTAETIVQRIAELQPDLEIPLDEIASLGLIEFVSWFKRVDLPSTLQEDLAAFDQALGSDDNQAFQEWMQNNWKAEYDSIYEFRTARELAGRPAVPWATLQSAMHACRVGERAAASDVNRAPWIRQATEAADRDQTEGIRALLDGVDPDRDGASKLLRDAAGQYERIREQTALVQRWLHLRNDLLMRVSSYVKLSYLTSEPPVEVRRVGQFLDALAEFSKGLEDLETASRASLERLSDRLSYLRSELEGGFQTLAAVSVADSDDPSWVMAYLATPLPTAAERVQLTVAASGSPEWVYSFSGQPAALLPPHLPTLRDWEQPATQADLELRLAAMAVASESDSTSATTLRSVFEREFRNAAAPPTWQAHRGFGDALHHFYQRRPLMIDELYRENRDLRDPVVRPLKIRQLRAAERGLRLLDDRDNGLVDAQSLAATLKAVFTYDLLAWQIARLQVQRADASGDEARFLTETASRYRLLAIAQPEQPPLAPERPPLLRIEGPTSVSLQASPQRAFTWNVASRATRSQSIWLIFAYDPTLLEVTIDDLAGIYVQHDLRNALAEMLSERREAIDLQVSGSLPADSEAQTEMSPLAEAETAAEYPYRPDVFALAPTLTLEPGQSRSVRVTVRALGRATQPANLILKGITDRTYVRRTVPIALPTDATFQLTAHESPETWTAVGGGLELHPMAGHDSTYRLQLANRGMQDIAVDVELLALQRAVREPLPEALFTPDQLERVLQRLQPLTSLNKIDDLRLPADATPVRLRFAPSDNEADSAATDAIEEEDDSKDPESPESDGAGEPLTSVRHGMLLLVTDQETQESILRRIDFKPRRPRRYLEATAAYDLGRERLSVRVRPLDPAQVPEQGFQVSCEFPEPLPRGAEAQLHGVVSAPDYEAVLYADVPASSQSRRDGVRARGWLSPRIHIPSALLEVSGLHS